MFIEKDYLHYYLGLKKDSKTDAGILIFRYI